MSEESPVLQGTKSLTGPPERPRNRLMLIAVVVALSYGFLSDTREIMKDIKLSEGLDVAAAKLDGMFSIPAEIFDEFKACNYEYLFFCEPKREVEKCPSRMAEESQWETCVSNVVSPDLGAPDVSPPWWQSIPIVNVPIEAAVRSPRLPDAAFQMLKVRWSQGPLEFQQGLLFLFAFITMLVVALRQKSASLWAFIVTVVYGPYLIIVGFGILQHALAGASVKVTLFTAETTANAGTITCLVICAWHGLKSMFAEARVLIKAL